MEAQHKTMKLALEALKEAGCPYNKNSSINSRIAWLDHHNDCIKRIRSMIYGGEQ